MNISNILNIGILSILAMFSGSMRAEIHQASIGAALESIKNIPIVVPTNQGVPAGLTELSNAQVMLEIPNETHVLLLRVDGTTSAAPSHYQRLIERSLNSKGTIVLQGSKEALLALKPQWIRVWPEADTVVLTSRFGTRVEGLRDEGVEDWRAIAQLIAGQIEQARSAEAQLANDKMSNGLRRAKRSTGTTNSFTKNVEFSVRPSSPVEACTMFGNGFAANTFGRPLTPSERDEVSSEVSRWCQSGTLSYYQGASAPRNVPNWTYTKKPKLSLLTEWALIRSEDVLTPSNSKHYFWVKSIGQGAGSGFTRNLQDTAFYSNNVMYGLLDATIHAGWGNIYPQLPKSWTFPVGEADWADRDPNLFGCDSGERGSVCPAGVSVIRLFPSDTSNNQVMVSQGESFTFGGMVNVSSQVFTDPSKAIKADLILKRMDSSMRTATLNLTNTQTSSGKPYSRSTRWRPDVAAIWDYVVMRGIEGAFATATPTAATINPEYDILWQIPTQPNQGKLMKFNVVYEAGWNNCVKYVCAGMQSPPDPTIPPQGRVYWTDGVVVDFRS
ncbi:hypothetical protein [Burkholderia pyrrocinia]|uniref:hypothetical protein n=1 Tax=Burkholderia pyrrocinia TaxID=60550 RepID=UPI001FC8D24B|nr:hypothetical protein [Burkholderia pyrrocinia]